MQVHVKTKLPLEYVSEPHRVKKTLGGIRTDVIGVGTVQPHTLDHSDMHLASLSRTGSISVVGKSSSGAMLLLSGHASLPDINGVIARTFSPGTVSIHDPVVGNVFTGTLMAGSIGGDLDYAVASVTVSASQRSSWHQTAGKYAPLTIRSSTPAAGERLHQLSQRGSIYIGFAGQGLVPLSFNLPDGTPVTYHAVLSVTPDNSGPFSIGGDSGSIVVDDSRRVVGTVLAGASNGSVSYVLPITPLYSQLGSQYTQYFFQ